MPATLEKRVPLALRFAEPLVSQEEIDETLGGKVDQIFATKISPTHTATGPKVDIVPDDE